MVSARPAWAMPGNGARISSAPSMALATSAVARPSATSRRPLPSERSVDWLSSTGLKASASRRQKRTL